MINNKLQIRNSTAEFLIFTNHHQAEGIEVRFQNEMVWLTQRLMAKLFDCSTDNISLHLKNIFADHELNENSVTEYFSATAADGKKALIRYTLDRERLSRGERSLVLTVTDACGNQTIYETKFKW